MNPFDDKNIIINRTQEDRINRVDPTFPLPPKNLQLVERPSKVEGFIGKASGSIYQVLKFMFYIVCLITFFALFKPYLKFIYEFSEWLTNKISYLF